MKRNDGETKEGRKNNLLILGGLGGKEIMSLSVVSFILCQL